MIINIDLKRQWMCFKHVWYQDTILMILMPYDDLIYIYLYNDIGSDASTKDRPTISRHKGS